MTNVNEYNDYQTYQSRVIADKIYTNFISQFLVPIQELIWQAP